MKPWLTKGLSKSIKKKNALYKQFLSSPTVSHKRQYKCFRNKLNHLLRIAKRDYYDKKLTEYKSNVKNTWRILNEIINRRQCNLTCPSTFRVADREISDPVEIANGFCDYFTNLGPSLAGKIPASNKPFSSLLKSNVVNSVFFPSTYQQEIVEICASLRSGSAAGFDNIHTDVVQQNIDIISKPLTRIINLSLSSGTVPKQLKIARIIPLLNLVIW